MKYLKQGIALLEIILLVFSFCACSHSNSTIVSQTDTYTENRHDSSSPIVSDNTAATNNKNYEQLLTGLNTQLKKKNFSTVANEFFRNTLDKLYVNYPQWQKAYKNMPNVSEYIQMNLINAIPKINHIHCYEQNSKEAKELDQQGEALGFTTPDFEITLVYTEITDETSETQKKEHEDDIERFFHEVTHCNQNNIVFNYDFFDNDYDRRMMFIEGSATFHSKFVQPLSTEQFSSWSVSNEDETRLIEYQKGNGLGYLVNLNAYEHLVYLAGYQTIYRVEQGEPYALIEESIAQKYGKENANKLMNTIHEWFTKYTENYKGEEIYNLSLKLQNLYLNYIKEDIDRLDINDKKQIKKYMNIYRHYKLKNFPQVTITYEENGSVNEKNCTNEIFDIDSIDRKLIKKIVQSNAVKPFSTNPKLNEMAIKTLLFASNDAYYQIDGIYDTIYLPHTIENIKYEYFENEQKNKGEMQFKYRNESQLFPGKVSLSIYFNENEILEIKETPTKD